MGNVYTISFLFLLVGHDYHVCFGSEDIRFFDKMIKKRPITRSLISKMEGEIMCISSISIIYAMRTFDNSISTMKLYKISQDWLQIRMKLVIVLLHFFLP